MDIGGQAASRQPRREGESSLLAGYEILSQIGVGARSTIHKVVETRTRDIYALKRVLRQGEDDDRFIIQAETEYEVSSKINHEYLRHSYAIHRVKKWIKVRELYVLMEHVEGKTMEAARPNRLDGFLQIMRKVAIGLDALHDAGYVHADVKPSNVILGPDGVVKIIDSTARDASFIAPIVSAPRTIHLLLTVTDYRDRRYYPSSRKIIVTVKPK